MSANVAAIIWGVGIIAWTIIRWPHRRVARKTKVVADKRSKGERVALGLCILGLVVVPIVHLATDLFSFADYSFQPWQGWIGAVVLVGFLVLFHLSHKHLGKNWSVTLEVREDHGLVDTGVYRFVRHPMYSSFWLWGVAQALLIPNWVAGFTGIAAVAWLYFSRIGREEAMMREQFGEVYDAYSVRTPRIIPKIFG